MADVCAFYPNRFSLQQLSRSACRGVHDCWMLEAGFWRRKYLKTKGLHECEEASKAMLGQDSFFFVFPIFYSSIYLHPGQSLPSSALRFQYFPPNLPSHPPIPSSSIPIQERPGLPWVSTKHSILSCNKTEHLTCIMAGQSDPVWGVGSNNQLTWAHRDGRDREAFDSVAILLGAALCFPWVPTTWFWLSLPWVASFQTGIFTTRIWR